MTSPGENAPSKRSLNSAASRSISRKVRSTASRVSRTAASDSRRASVADHAARRASFTSGIGRHWGCEGSETRYFVDPSFSMKADIHPNYRETEISCACGAVYHTRSTKQDIKIGICAACHPFFTGEQKFVDTAGRVEKFTRRYGATAATRIAKKA